MVVSRTACGIVGLPLTPNTWIERFLRPFMISRLVVERTVHTILQANDCKLFSLVQLVNEDDIFFLTELVLRIIFKSVFEQISIKWILFQNLKVHLVPLLMALLYSCANSVMKCRVGRLEPVYLHVPRYTSWLFEGNLHSECLSYERQRSTIDCYIYYIYLVLIKKKQHTCLLSIKKKRKKK